MSRRIRWENEFSIISFGDLRNFSGNFKSLDCKNQFISVKPYSEVEDENMSAGKITGRDIIISLGKNYLNKTIS